MGGVFSVLGDNYAALSATTASRVASPPNTHTPNQYYIMLVIRAELGHPDVVLEVIFGTWLFFILFMSARVGGL